MLQREAVSLGWDSHGCLNDFGVVHDTCVFSEIGFWSSFLRQTSKPHQTIMSMNRHNNTSPTCSTSNPTTQTNEINHEPSQTNQNDNQWPRFLIMEAADKKIPLNLNVFTLKKAVDGMANGVTSHMVNNSTQKYVKCKPTKSRQHLNRSREKTPKQKSVEDNYANGLYSSQSLTTSDFKLKKICHKMTRTGQHGRSNKKLKPQGTIAVKRISVRYSLYVMTIKGQDIPEKINIGYLKKETRPYIPNPQRCFLCQKFGHTKISCKGNAVCAGCGEEGHTVDDCQNDPKCVNCEDHHAISKDCPIWKYEKDIVTLMYKENISFADARKRVQPISDPSKNSYASVTQTIPQSARPLQPWARNIRPPTDFQTEVQFLKYILNYCLTRLDAIGNEQIPVHHMGTVVGGLLAWCPWGWHQLEVTPMGIRCPR